MFTESNFLMISATEKVSCNVSFDCKITFICNNWCFIVLLSHCSLLGVNNLNFVKERYLKRLDDALKSKDSLKVNTTIKEIFDFVTTLCQVIFWESASVVENEPQVLDLDFCLNSKIFKLQVMTVDEKSKVIRCNDNTIMHLTFSDLQLWTIAVNLNLSKFSLKHVKILKKYKKTSILKILTCGQVMCCKMINHQTYLFINWEFCCLQWILTVRLNPSLVNIKALWSYQVRKWQCFQNSLD